MGPAGRLFCRAGWIGIGQGKVAYPCIFIIGASVSAFVEPRRPFARWFGEGDIS